MKEERKRVALVEVKLAQGFDPQGSVLQVNEEEEERMVGGTAHVLQVCQVNEEENGEQLRRPRAKGRGRLSL